MTASRISPHLLDDVSLFRSYVNRIFFMSAPLGNGGVGASILPREVAGTHCHHQEPAHA